MHRIEKAPDERRSAERLQVIVPLDATLDSKALEIVDLSLGGARLRHWHAVARGYMRLRFTWNGAQFNEAVTLMSSRIVEVSEHRTSYESRVSFPAVGTDSSAALEHAVRALHDRRLAAWMANVRGDVAEAAPAEETAVHAGSPFIVCTYSDRLWRRHVRKHRADGPKNGFAVRASVSEGEIRRLCDAFAAADDDGRELLRLFAHHLV